MGVPTRVDDGTARIWSHSVVEDSPHKKYKVSQRFYGQLNPVITLAKNFVSTGASQPKHAKQLVHLDLSNSYVSADHDHLLDEDDCRGYFIDRVVYSAWLQGHTATPSLDISQKLPNWLLAENSPDTADATGSFTSSVSYNVGVSGGAMGPAPMGTVDASVGFSSTHNHSVKDFEFQQVSRDGILKHELTMAQSRDGSKYRVPADLVEGPQLNHLTTTRILELPLLATSNFPIAGQGIWVNRDDSGLIAKIDLWVMVEMHFVVIEGWEETKWLQVGPFPTPVPIGSSRQSVASLAWGELYTLDFGQLS